MKIENGKLILERKECSYCNQGKQSSRKVCTSCKGTGNGKRGGKRGCKVCYGNCYVWDHNNPIPCTTCNGDYKNRTPETDCDYLPDSIFPALPFVVYRVERSMTLGESLIGLNSVFSCSDYGRAYRTQNDAALIESVRSHQGVQACKVVNEAGELCDHIGIFVKFDGYVVKPVFKK